MALAPQPKYRCLIADWNGEPSGFAFFHYNYSTWRGQAGLYLEDLFVLLEMRGKGIGKALLQKLAQIALEENFYGLRWMVLEWNDPALKFYESLGAELLGEWETMLLRGEPLQRLAGTQRHSGFQRHEGRNRDSTCRQYVSFAPIGLAMKYLLLRRSQQA